MILVQTSWHLLLISMMRTFKLSSIHIYCTLLENIRKFRYLLMWALDASKY
jgi:hypothetical protein